MPANRVVPLVDREALGGAHFLLTFRHPEVAREARPGQFVMIKAGLSAEPPLRRPFSILSVDAGRETVTLFVKALGQGSRGLCAMAPGDEAQCLGPLGRPFTPAPAGVEALLVAGGYGVAPLRFLGEEARQAGGRARRRNRRRPRLPDLGVCPHGGAATEDGTQARRSIPRRTSTPRPRDRAGLRLRPEAMHRRSRASRAARPAGR
jgi:hypothetical protein